ncbi:hypothetical protein [Candidatus Nitrotoga sp. AM1P]|uniref:hypothetical protein n=1 Tax=Candidatus Nitrotoga sp. AM1P TaxID=2559597 RepID=UPI0010B968D9|nr:hypothetical protein [Candidatus Nitrotoga sp. AM1P]BBJ22274.1 hypothetical protein W01_02010 [Candidatus Nitrotoga sp. AM1P]
MAVKRDTPKAARTYIYVGHRQNQMSQLVFAHMTSRKSTVVSATDEELADVRLLCERAEKLDAAQAKYGSPMSTFSRNQDSRETIFAANTPDVDDITNLAVKFRFFYANKKPTQY